MVQISTSAHNIHHQQKRKRKTDKNVKEGDECEDVDVISSLPDEILIHLLSFLEVKTAGRSSILSKRWRHVWTYMTELDFEKANVKADMNNFCNCIDKVIAANRAPYLNKFRIHYMGVGSNTADIDRWFKFAFCKKVRNLELFLMTSYTGFGSPTIQFSNTRALLGNTTLECLRLKYVSIDATLLEWVVSNCINLQRLSISGCKPSSLSNATPKKLVVSSPKLKHLELSYCLKPLNFEALHVSAPNLTSITLFDQDPTPSAMFKYINIVSSLAGGLNINFLSVPSLVDASFGWLYCRHLFLQNLDIISSFSSQLDKLAITWDEALFKYHAFPTFANVKHLEITFQSFSLNLYNQGDGLLELTPFIEACPSLHIFTLKLITLSRLEQSSEVKFAQLNAIRAHQHLKIVEFVGFDGSQSATQFATHLIWNAPMLKKFVFDTRHPLSIRIPRDFNGEDKRAYARRKAEMIAIQEGIDVVIL